jgi:hypothetical protein
MAFSDLKGTVISSICVEDDVIWFYMKDGLVYRMLHHQDCCESVWIEDVCGDLLDLLETEILRAEERCQIGECGDYESHTWTFYELSTIKGSVTIRWHGESNGYYSEGVDFEEYKE